MKSFISVGTLAHSFGPIEDVVWMPYLSAHGMLRLNLDWFLRLWGTSVNSKRPFINSGAMSVLTLNTSVISSCRYRWCKVVELSLLSSSPKDELKSLYITRKALPWSLLMRLSSFWRWNIHTTGQYENNSLASNRLYSKQS